MLQLHPVVSRLCASIQGTSPERLADCLGLDASKVELLSYCVLDLHLEAINVLAMISIAFPAWRSVNGLQFQHKSSEAFNGDPSNSLLFAADDKER